MNRPNLSFPILTALVTLLACGTATHAQSILTGRLVHTRYAGSDQEVPMTAIHAFASPTGPVSQAMGFRTFETHPVGWYFMPGPPGRYTLLFSNPAKYMRPLLMTNIYAHDGERIDKTVSPDMDYWNYHDGSWDEDPATHYYQTFDAGGTSLTHVGFKFATDGVDGPGPGSQDLVISIHRKADGTPDTWPQVGTEMPVLNVDCGGPKGYSYSCGWNSGEVPLVPGNTYAVHFRALKEGGVFQTFWREDADKTTDCYRIGPEGETGFTGHDMWLAVGTDCDGLVIPYNKRVHKEFCELTTGDKVWSQTYVAQGRSLAAAMMYGAVSGTQPSLMRQRMAVHVRKGGPGGEIVGVVKYAVGNGNYTGDASWGMFGAVYVPGEVPLVPGETYAIEFESVESYETLAGHVDIKGRASIVEPSLTPYRKCDPDDYPHGTAYKHGKEAMDYDLDMQIIEYAHESEDWSRAVHAGNLLTNGNMESGDFDADDPDGSQPDGWKPFAVDPGTTHQWLIDGNNEDNRVLRVVGGGINGKTVDGGFVQRVDALSPVETYRLSGRLRSSYPIDEKHACCIGYDPTGQVDDPAAVTIVWTKMPRVHGIFVPYASEPIRPTEEAISVWLRGTTVATDGFAFKCDFDEFALRKVNTGVPSGIEADIMSFNIRYGTASDGENAWPERKDLVIDVIREHEPDVIGLQEALRFQLDEILGACQRFGEIGGARDDGKEQGEYSAILYDKQRFAVDEHGTFWLSDTPGEPGSKSWGNNIPRICTWARLTEKTTSRSFYLYNTHLDHASAESREHSVALIARRIHDRPHPDPVVVTGDFNAGETSPPVRYLTGAGNTLPSVESPLVEPPSLVDTFRVAHLHAVDVGTFSGFAGRRTGEKIDYVLAPPSASVLGARIVRDHRGGRYPSDHYPVTARLLLPSR